MIEITKDRLMNCCNSCHSENDDVLTIIFKRIKKSFRGDRKMIDCKITENYFAEKARMTGANDNGTCMIECAKCPLSLSNNGECESCFTLEKLYYNKAIEIVQKWSNKHHRKTILDDLKEKYPNYQRSVDEIPNICPYKLGYKDNKKCPAKRCEECWNRPLDE